MEATVLQPLDWDETEPATTQSIRRPSATSVRRSSQGWLVITNEWPSHEETARDGEVSEAPTTERARPPIPDRRPAPRSLAVDSPPTRKCHELAGGSETVTTLSDSDVQVGAHASALPPPRSMRSLPTSMAIPLTRDAVGERATPQRTNSIDMEALTAPLTLQIAHLRRWLMVSLLLAAVATVTAAVAVVAALGGPHIRAAELPWQGDSTATRASTPRTIDAPLHGHLKRFAARMRPAAPPAAATEATSDNEPTRVPADGKVAVVISLSAKQTVVTVTQGARQRMVHGPYPTTVRLAPGTYTLTAYRPGFRIFQRRLELSASRPVREIAIAFD